MNLVTAQRLTALFVIASLAAGPLACSGPSASERSESDPSDQSSAGLAQPAASHGCGGASDGGACVPLGGSCGLSSAHPTGPCCDPAARCIEYTVYDYARCRVPSPAGAYCYRNEQCLGGSCDPATATCSP